MKNHYIRKLLFHFVEEPLLVELATKWLETQIDDPDSAASAKFIPPHEIDDPDTPSFELADHNVVRLLYDFLDELSVDTLRRKCLELDLIPEELAIADCHNVPISISQSDLKFWGKKFKWTPFETVLLSLGYSPKSDLISRLERLFDFTAYSRPWYPILLEIKDRLELLNAADAFHPLVSPLELIAWMERLELVIPDNLKHSISYFQKPPLDNNSVETDVGFEKDNTAQSLSEIEKNTLMKLVAGMSIRGYSFDPSAMRNQATADIQSDLDFLGISLDQKTILKWIRTSCELVDQKNLP